MRAIYLNKYEDISRIFYDLSYEIILEDSGETEILLRLSGVSFQKDYTFEDLQTRAIEIARLNLSDYELKEIILT